MRAQGQEQGKDKIPGRGTPWTGQKCSSQNWVSSKSDLIWGSSSLHQSPCLGEVSLQIGTLQPSVGGSEPEARGF